MLNPMLGVHDVVAEPELDTDDPSSVGVIAEITGSNVHPNVPIPCPHPSFGQQVTVGVVEDGAGGSYYEAKLKLRCDHCGAPAAFLIGSVRPSLEDHEQGLVCRFELVDE